MKKLLALEIEKCADCPFISAVCPLMCTNPEAIRERGSQVAVEADKIPDWCPLSEPIEVEARVMNEETE